MPNLNVVTLAGHVGLDPNVRYSQNDNCIADFSLATSWGKKDKQTGEWENFTDWHKVVAFGKLGEKVAEKLKKGSPVFLTGTIRYESWEDDQGNKRYATKIIANNINILTKVEEQPAQKPADPGDVDPNDDLPF